MPAAVGIVIRADDSHDLAEAISELMIALHLGEWDDSDETCERLLAWLRNGHAPTEL